MTEPICDQRGCCCQWARAQTDDGLAVAYSCLTREVFKRSGVNVLALTEATARTMDGDQIDAIARLTRWAGADEKAS